MGETPAQAISAASTQERRLAVSAAHTPGRTVAGGFPARCRKQIDNMMMISNTDHQHGDDQTEKGRPVKKAPKDETGVEGAAAGQDPQAGRPFGALLHRLSQRLHEELERALEPLGFAPQHYFVLFNLWRYGPRSQLSLGGCAAINRTTMVSLIDRLEGLGLVQRRRDPKDRRAYIIHLTAKGGATLDRAMVLHREAEARCLQPLSREEQELLRGLLGRLVPSPSTEAERS
jgi:DNA-binding MarR family transcriptional regulator